MQMLKEVFNTRYITNGNAPALRRILEMNREEVYDLAGCIISKTVADCIEMFPLQFIDSQDSSRSYVLELNKKSFLLRATCDVVELPRRASEDVVSYIKALDPETIYSISDEKQFPLASIVFIMSPKIKLSLGYLTQKFGAYLSNYLYQRDISQALKFFESTDSFLRYHEKYLEPIKVTSYTDMTIVTTAGTFDTMDLFADVILLPACIGNERVNNQPLYSSFWESILTEVYAPENRDVSLFDLLQRK